MNKVLFDLTPFQDHVVNGGALYAKNVLEALLENKDIEVIGMAIAPENINFKLFDFDLTKNIEIVKFDENIFDYANNNASVVFIAISQRYNSFDLSRFKCRVLMVCHDLFDFYLTNAGLNSDISRQKFVEKATGFKRSLKSKVKKILLNMRPVGFVQNNEVDASQLFKNLGYENFSKVIKKKNFYVITVSEYSKNALLYYFNGFANDISVLYPPEVINNIADDYHNKDLSIGKKYFLLLSCNRYSKNTYLFYRVFKKWNQSHSNEYAVVFVGISHSDLDNAYCFKHVSNDDLVYLMKNCYAVVYPSFAEGFGYPPIEAMKFGKPVLAAFDTSIPEICGDAALFFNPLYEEDLFYKQNLLLSNYDSMVERAKNRYVQISNKQKSDLQKIVNIIKGDASE